MAFGNYWELTMMQHFFNIQSGTTTTLYLGLSSADPGEDGSGTSEPTTGKGYARVKVTNGSGSSFSVEDSTGVTVSNTALIQFPTASATWGTLTYAAIFSGSTSGSSICARGILTSSVTPASGQAPQFAANACKFGLR